MDQKTKNVPLEKFLKRTILKPGHSRHEALSTLHRPKNDILAFSKFLQKNVFRHNKIIFLHLLNKSRGIATLFFQITTPKIIQKCAGAFLSSQESFFCRNLKNTKMTFLGRCNVETALWPGFQGLSCSKVAKSEVLTKADVLVIIGVSLTQRSQYSKSWKNQKCF